MAHHTASYYEGYQAFGIKKDCKYGADALCERTDWAHGFAAALAEQRAGKVWYKSQTVRIGAVLLVVGMAVIGVGLWTDGSLGEVLKSVGGGISLSNLLAILVRTMASDPLYLSSGIDPTVAK